MSIAPKFPNFHFTWADVFNGYYNPKGKSKPHEYKLPYESDSFDLVIAYSVFTHMLRDETENYFSEISRVLKHGGTIVMVDVDYPFKGNGLGAFITKAWIAGGDIVRDMKPLFNQFGFEYTDEEIGGFGSVHLYIAKKR